MPVLRAARDAIKREQDKRTQLQLLTVLQPVLASATLDRDTMKILAYATVGVAVVLVIALLIVAAPAVVVEGGVIADAAGVRLAAYVASWEGIARLARPRRRRRARSRNLAQAALPAR
jgi:hypothetical protein